MAFRVLMWPRRSKTTTPVGMKQPLFLCLALMLPVSHGCRTAIDFKSPDLLNRKTPSWGIFARNKKHILLSFSCMLLNLFYPYLP
jgi:hypothetical protein